MNKQSLDQLIKQAKTAEDSESYFSAAIYYKEALEVANKANDSKLIKLCKQKVVEMNKKSIDSGKDFKEVEVSVNFSKKDQKIIKNLIKGIVELKDIRKILKIIGRNPYFCPNIAKVEKTAQQTIPLSYQITTLTTISDNGHNLRGGSNPQYSWLMDTYSREQKFIMEVYLCRIFYLLIKNQKMTIKELSQYFIDSKLFNSDQLEIILIGLKKYFDEDYVSAIHILIPQFESFLLEMTSKLGINTVVLDTKLDTATRTLTLSENHLESDDFKKVFGEDFCRQVKFVLFEPLGYKLRHKIAHGEIKFGECNFQNTTLILYLYLNLLGRIERKEKNE